MKTSESKYCNCLYFTAAAFARKVEKLAVAAWKPVGLSPSHGYLLLMVIEEPGVQPGTLSDHLQLAPSTISRLVDKLENKKLIVRIAEGKIANIYPSPAGKALLPKLKNCIHTFNEAYYALLGKENCGNLMGQIRKMADKLT